MCNYNEVGIRLLQKQRRFRAKKGMEAAPYSLVLIGFSVLALIFSEAADLAALTAEMPLVAVDLILTSQGSRKFYRFRSRDFILAIFEIEYFYSWSQKVKGSADSVLTMYILQRTEFFLSSGKKLGSCKKRSIFNL